MDREAVEREMPKAVLEGEIASLKVELEEALEDASLEDDADEMQERMIKLESVRRVYTKKIKELRRIKAADEIMKKKVGAISDAADANERKMKKMKMELEKKKVGAISDAADANERKMKKTKMELEKKKVGAIDRAAGAKEEVDKEKEEKKEEKGGKMEVKDELHIEEREFTDDEDVENEEKVLEKEDKVSNSKDMKKKDKASKNKDVEKGDKVSKSKDMRKEEKVSKSRDVQRKGKSSKSKDNGKVVKEKSDKDSDKDEVKIVKDEDKEEGKNDVDKEKDDDKDSEKKNEQPNKIKDNNVQLKKIGKNDDEREAAAAAKKKAEEEAAAAFQSAPFFVMDETDAALDNTNIRRLCNKLLAFYEVSIENENCAQAIENLNSCLEKRKDKLPIEMREIAETQYQLGVALSYHRQFDDAVKYFNDAKKVLSSLLDNLKSDTFGARVGKIDGLESLLPQIQDYHGISPDAVHESYMDVNKIKGNIDPTATVKSTKIRAGRSIDGFGLSPGITKEQKLKVGSLMKKAFAKLEGDLAGTCNDWEARPGVEHFSVEGQLELRTLLFIPKNKKDKDNGEELITKGSNANLWRRGVWLAYVTVREPVCSSLFAFDRGRSGHVGRPAR